MIMHLLNNAVSADENGCIQQSQSGKRRKFLSWGGRGAASIMDMALFNGSQFLLSILLARWLTIADYGRFSVIYSAIVFVNGVHMAVVSEPTLVFWARHSGNERRFLADTIFFNTLFSLILLSVVVILGFVLCDFGMATLGNVLLAVLLAVVQPFFWYFRQVAYAQLRPWWAVAQTAFYAALLLSGAVVMRWHGGLSMPSVFGVMAFACFLPVAWALGRMRPVFQWPLSPVSRQALRDCLRYSAWSAPSGVAGWAMMNVIIIAMPFLASLNDAAWLKVSLNILVPFQQVLIAVSLLALPTLTRAIQEKNWARARKLIFWFFIFAMSGGLAFSTVLWLWGDLIFHLFYGARYAGDYRFFRYGILLPLLWPAMTAAFMVLRAFQNPKSIFMAHVVTLGTVGIIAVPLGVLHGTQGALIAMTVMYAVLLLLLLRFVVREMRHPRFYEAQVDDAAGTIKSDRSGLRILLCGLPFSDNLGDGVIADCARALIKDHYPESEIRHFDISGRLHFSDGIKTDTRLRIFSRMPGPLRTVIVRMAMACWIGPRIARQSQGDVAWCDVAIIGGGQLFMDQDLNFPLKVHRIAMLLEKAGKPVGYYACGVARQWSSAAARLFRHALLRSNVRAISVRDPYSLLVIKEHLMDVNHVRAVLAPDPALYASVVYGARFMSKARPVLMLGGSSPTILNRFLNPQARQTRRVFREIFANAALQLAADFDVVLFTNGDYSDRVFLNELWSFLPPGNPSITRAPVPTRPEDLASLIRSADVLVSHRLHANIIAYSYGIPSVGLGWDTKIKEFFSMCRRDAFFLDGERLSTAAIVAKARAAYHAGIALDRRRELIDMTVEGLATLIWALRR